MPASPAYTQYNELASVFANGQFYGTALDESLINFEAEPQRPNSRSSNSSVNNTNLIDNVNNSQEVESIVQAISNRFVESEVNIKTEVKKSELRVNRMLENFQKKSEETMKALLDTAFIAVSNQISGNVKAIVEKNSHTEETLKRAIDTLDVKVKNLNTLLDVKNRQLEEINRKYVELKSRKEKTEISEVASDVIVNCMQGLAGHIVTDVSTKVLDYLDEHGNVNEQRCDVEIQDHQQQEQSVIKQVVQPNNSGSAGTGCQFTSINTQVPNNTSNVYTPGPQENLKNVKLFKIGDSADQWVTNFKYQSKFRNIPPSEWPRVMGLHMDWTAIAKYNTLLESQKAFISVIDDEIKFSSYEKLFVREFETVDNDSRVLSEIKSLEYRNFNNKNEYWNNLRNLVMRLNNTSTAVIYNLIHEKFPPHIKNAINTNVTLMREDPQTFIQSIQTICQNMSLTKSNDNYRQNNKNDYSKRWTFQNRTFSKNNNRNNDRNNKDNERYSFDKDRYKNSPCHFCNQYGHWVQECPQKKKQEPNTPPDSGNAQSRK